MSPQCKADNVRKRLLQFWHSHSDREIAGQLGVSNRTVSLHRKRLETEGLILSRPKSTQGGEAWPENVCTSAIKPAPLNDQLYAPINQQDSSFQALVRDIQEHGILEPLVVSKDAHILSGHRRYAAAKVLGIQRLPVRIRYDITYAANVDEFLKLLASYNRQRVKTTAEQTREEIILAEEDSAVRLQRFRRDTAQISSDGMVTLGTRKRRSAIRDKLELKAAIIRVIQGEKKNWPLSDRAVHYRLLNFPGLVRNDKTRTPYQNNAESYDDVTNMLTRLRLDGSVPFDAIADETRPVVLWKTHLSVGNFIREQYDGFLQGYWRNLLQSQPNWVELLVEKNTIATQLRSVSSKYTIPMTSGRGYSSLPPRKEMVDRFNQSGRDKLVVIVVSDFDPEGQDIPGSFGISLRDDFGVSADQLQIIKAALTEQQIQTLNLHEGQISKDTSSRYERFVAAHGERAWELESLTTDQLRQIVESAIRAVLDLSAFEMEVDQEQREQTELQGQRRRLRQAILNDIADHESDYADEDEEE